MKEELGGVFYVDNQSLRKREKGQCLRMFQIQRRVGAIRKDKHIKS